MGQIVKPPDLTPITIGCYTMTDTGIEINGKPTFNEHDSVGEFIRRAHKASGWWLADWLRYGETRPDWRERLDQIVDATHFSERTVRNIKNLGENVPRSRRRADVDFSLHFEVAKLKPAEQTEWLTRAAEEGWTVRDLRRNIVAAKRPTIIEGQAKLAGQFRVVLADPAWTFRDNVPPTSGARGKTLRHYPTLPVDAICKLPVAAHALPDSVLFLWVPASILPDAFKVIDAWGFDYKTQIVWDKVLGNWGHYVRVHHENLLIATRGSCMPDVPTPMPDSVQVVRREGERSEKPEHFRKLIEQLYTRGPYLELYARRKVKGWTTLGNDARLWTKEATA